MDRVDKLRRYVTKDALGIEIGPWHSPIAPKSEGFNCLSLDVVDTDTLRRTAQADPHVDPSVISRIEDVDLVGPVSSILPLLEERGLVGKIDYLISSHNFEHFPNPIQFFQDCGKALKPNGVISMAIPDRRGSFDYFRPFTTLASWLDAYFEERWRPTYAQVFELHTTLSFYLRDGKPDTGMDYDVEDPSFFEPQRTLRSSYDSWKSRKASNDQAYIDTHVAALTPAVLNLLVSDARFLGLIPFDTIDISPTTFAEFYSYFRNTGYTQPIPDEEANEHYEQRKLLLHEIMNETGCNSKLSRELKAEILQLRQQVRALTTGAGESPADNEPPFAEIERLQACRERLLSEKEGLHAEIERLRIDNEQLARINAQIEEQRRAIEVHAGELSWHLDALRQSTSWRITSPFRKLRPRRQ